MKLTQELIVHLNRQAKAGAKINLTLASGTTYHVKSLANQYHDAHGHPDPTICETLEVWLVDEKRTLRVPADQVTSLEVDHTWLD